MHHIIGGILIGAIFATPRPKSVRPALRAVVRTGLVAQRKAQEMTESARTQFRTLVDEAKQEMNASPSGGAQ